MTTGEADTGVRSTPEVSCLMNNSKKMGKEQPLSQKINFPIKDICTVTLETVGQGEVLLYVNGNISRT